MRPVTAKEVVEAPAGEAGPTVPVVRSSGITEYPVIGLPPSHVGAVQFTTAPSVSEASDGAMAVTFWGAVAATTATVTVPEVPVIELVTVSVPVTVCVPAVLKVTGTSWTPASVAV